FRASLADAQLKFVAVKTGFPKYPAASALKDKAGHLWFAYGDELVEINEGRLINYGAVDQVLSLPSEIASIVEDHTGRILVAYLKGIFEFVPPVSPAERGQWRRVDFNPKPNQNIRKLLVDSAADLYIGMNGGLLKRTPDGRQIEISSRAAGTYNAYDLIEDRDRNIWISAWANGVYKLAGEMIASYTNSDGSNLRTSDVFEDGGVLKTPQGDEGVIELSDG